MALVRLATLLGEAPASRPVTTPTGYAAQQPIHPPHLPQQAGPAPAPAAEVAAAAPTMPAGSGAILASFGLVAVGGLVAYLTPPPGAFRIGSAMAAYVAMLVFAAAVERLLEPFSHWLPGTRARNAYEATTAAMMNGYPAATLPAVAAAKAALDRAVANRGVVVWGMATALATVVSSSAGFYLLRMIAAPGWQPGIPPWVDAIVTGLVVGSGTKPLHDLITRVQATNESRAEKD